MKTNQIIQGDAIERLEELPEKSINMWLSGIIDGEGCLSMNFCKQRTSPNPAVKIEITIAGTSKEFLEVIRKIVGYGSINERTFYEYDNRKRSWVYRMPTGAVRKILPNLFLIVKKEQRVVLLEALSLLRGKGPNKRSVKIERRLINLKQELHRLNKRGRK